MDQPPRSNWARWAIGALIVLRLIYISHDEIRAFPYDEAAYIMQAKAWYWGNAYNSWAYTRQPGFPLFIACSAALGVPLRLSLEALWIVAALSTIAAAARAGLRPAGRVLLLALLLFHPFASDMLTHAQADNLYTPAWLIFTVATGAALGADGAGPVRRWGALAATAGAIAANTRQETALVYTLSLAAGALAVARRDPSGLWRRRLLAGAVLPLVLAFVSVQAVNAANWRRIGSYTGYDWSVPGFRTLYSTLLSIPPQHPIVNVPIPADVRRRAAALSPNFARLESIMETSPRCEPFRREGERLTGIPGEPGYFMLWMLREAVWVLNDDQISSAAQFDALCRRVSDEIRDGARRDGVPLRWAPLSFIPPDWGQLARRIPAAVPQCWARMTRIGFDRDEPYPVGPVELGGFDRMALRRSSLVALARPAPADAPRSAYREQIERLDDAKRALGAEWPAVSWALLLATGAGWAAALWSRRRRPDAPPPRAWWTLASIVSLSLLLRLALMAALHATGMELVSRYAFPAASLLVIAGILGLRGTIFTMTREAAKA